MPGSRRRSARWRLHLPGSCSPATGQRGPTRASPRPGRDLAAPVLLADVQVADVGPACLAGEPLAVGSDLDLDVADDVAVEDGGQPGAVQADPPACLEPGQRRRGQAGAVAD